MALTNKLINIADAIRQKRGIDTPLTLDDMPIQIGLISGGGSGLSSGDDVRFYDYDGSIVAAYSSADFMSLSEMPPNPSHDGLVSQGWNWSIADAKTHVAQYRELDIGQMYATSDGKTRIRIHLDECRTTPMLGCCPNGTVVIDWGDGTGTESLTGTSLTTVKWTKQHEYPRSGDYVITLTVNGSASIKGTSGVTAACTLLRHSGSGSNINYTYRNAIKSVFVGDNIKIDTYAFYYCMALSEITLPKGCNTIGSYAFGYCRNLKNISIPDTVTSLSNNLFESCNSIASVCLPNCISVINSSVFRTCYSLQRVTIPNSVSKIGASAFQNCQSLGYVVIPDSVSEIGNSAFYSCYSLGKVVLPQGIQIIDTNLFYYCYSLTSIEIPDGVTSIGASAFYNCSSLSSIEIPDGVTSIGGSAFYGCNTILSLHIPQGVTKFLGSTFYGCFSLTSIEIPSGVTDIGASAFANCYSLGAITFCGSTPPTVSNSSAWSSVPACKIYVPSGSMTAYTTATNYPSSSTFTYAEK